MQKVAVKRDFEAGLRRLEKSLCQPCNKWVLFFELRQDKAAKGEEWAPLSSAVSKIQFDSNPLCPFGIRLWETFTFTNIIKIYVLRSTVNSYYQHLS